LRYEPDTILLYPVWLVWTAIVLVLWLVDHIVLAPTIGPIRLAIHHSRSPGWYLRVRRTTAPRSNMRTVELELQASTKASARQLRGALTQESRQGVDLNTPSIRATIATNHAIIAPQRESQHVLTATLVLCCHSPVIISAKPISGGHV
jgi:hypothetical protein